MSSSASQRCEQKPIVVTIDGPAGTGKSTVARKLAEKLDFSFLNTGAMYRAVAWITIQEGIDPHDENAVSERAARIQFGMAPETVLVDGHDRSEEFRGDEVGAIASVVAAHEKVRAILVQSQRELANDNSLVSEGRDQGTVVFPHATCKFFLTARPEVRAQRRFRDLRGSSHITYEEILKSQEERDRRDENRTVGALTPAPDAEVIDSSDLTLEEVLARLVQKVRQARKTC